MSKKQFSFTLHNQPIEVTVSGRSGKIVSGYPRDTCPSCDQPLCNISCDGSQGADQTDETTGFVEETEDEANERVQFNRMLDMMEAIVLAHACRGINVADPSYIGGLETALEAAVNNT